MSRRYRYAACVSFGDDGEPGYVEVDVEVTFTVAWGSPETGRFGAPEHYDPGAPDEVEDVRVETVDGRHRPWDRLDGYGSDDELEEMILGKLDDADLNTAALEQEAARAFDPDRARDERIDRDMMERA